MCIVSVCVVQGRQSKMPQVLREAAAAAAHRHGAATAAPTSQEAPQEEPHRTSSPHQQLQPQRRAPQGARQDAAPVMSAVAPAVACESSPPRRSCIRSRTGYTPVAARHDRRGQASDCRSSVQGGLSHPYCVLLQAG